MIGARRACTSAVGLLAVALLVSACATVAPRGQELVVTATAYNSVGSQTDRTPEFGAWGDRLRPGMRAVAVSADLHALGLVRGARVRIEGLRGEYQVLDRMPRRWQRRIDILMADRQSARSWGKRTVRIRWAPPAEGRRWGFLCGLFGTCG
jgi:3D (Asp-Asp-Asp) domain-containing protein